MTKRFTDRLEEFHNTAIQAANGWSDFGGNDYRPGLEQFCAAIDASADIDASLHFIFEQQIVTNLKGRLYSEHYKKQNPGYAGEVISKPIFIVGLPRSGTTALHKMLAAAPGNQSLEYWLGQTPMPRPERSQWSETAEFVAAKESLEFLHQMAPDVASIHDMRADEADECRLLLLQSFANVTLQSLGPAVPQYEQWLYTTEFDEVYRRYADNLRLIGLNNSAQWVLKDPSHLWAPNTLLQTFPDARLVQTHRHPRHLLPSVASLVYSMGKMVVPDLDKHAIGQRELKQWSCVLNNLAEVRAANQYLPVCDVFMSDLIREPMLELARIYDRFDIEMTAEARSGIEHWIGRVSGQNPVAHNYTLEEFGLSEDAVCEAFSTYIEYFDIRD